MFERRLSTHLDWKLLVAVLAIALIGVVTLDAGTDVRDALHAFGKHAVRRLPIVSGGKVSGLLLLDDVVVALAGQFGEVTRGMSAQLLFPHAFDEPSPPAPIG